MKKALFSLYEGFSKTKTVVTLLVAAVYLVLVQYSGGSVAEVALFAVVLLFYIVLPGFLFARLLRAKNMAPGYTGPLALLYGVGFFAALYCVTMRLGILWLLRILPPLLGVLWLVLCALEWRKGTAAKKSLLPRPAPQPAQWMLILLFSALLLLFAFYGVVKNGRPLAVGDMLLSQDMLWNIGNANSFKLAFPPEDIRFSGVRLSYHYLTELVAGALSLASGISCYNILAFYLQPFVLGALVLCLYRFGRLVFKENNFKTLLFTYSLFLFGCASLWKILPNGASVFHNANIIHLVTNINSQATAVVMLCLFLGLFVSAARQKYKMGVAHWLSLLAAFFLLCFAKGPLAILVAIAVGLTVVIGLFMKQGWRGLVLGVLIGAMFIVVYNVMFASGANDSMQFSISATIAKGYFYNLQNVVWLERRALWYVLIPVLWVVQSFLMMPAQFPLFIAGGVRDILRFKHLPAEKLLFNAMAIGGLLAYFLFDHPSLSQAYFLYAALFFASLLAVDNLDMVKTLWGKARRAVPGEKRQKLKLWWNRALLAGLACCTAVGVATAGFLYVHMLGSGTRQLLRNLGVTEKYPYELVVTPDDEAAMLWLQNNSAQSEMFATNRIHTGPTREGISNVYSALSGRQAFMEGHQYAKTNMGVAQDVIDERLAVNTALFSADTPPEQIPLLCQENGISYLVFCRQMDGVDASDVQMSRMELCYDSDMVRIYKLPGLGNNCPIR